MQCGVKDGARSRNIRSHSAALYQLSYSHHICNIHDYRGMCCNHIANSSCSPTQDKMGRYHFTAKWRSYFNPRLTYLLLAITRQRPSPFSHESLYGDHGLSWSDIRGLNSSPSPWQGDALPNELIPHHCQSCPYWRKGVNFTFYIATPPTRYPFAPCTALHLDS